MYKIVSKQELAPNIKLMGIEAEHVVKNAKAGNFLVVITDEKGERIPLTIYDFDRSRGIVYIIFQEIGASTIKLGRMNVGDSLFAVAGPLGKHFHSKHYGNVVLIGGGVGVPAIFPIARELKKHGNKVTSVIGFRNKELVILEHEMAAVSDNIFVTTNDGSHGAKGFVTDVLLELASDADEHIDLVVAIGPIVMMKAVTELCVKLGLKIIVSLNTLMVDGTGMCGACRVHVGGVLKFSCVEGPDFDGTLIDFKEITNRQDSYKEQENHSLHKCRLDESVEKAEKNG
jgi:ferredoxin--NADP+ reductase